MLEQLEEKFHGIPGKLEYQKKTGGKNVKVGERKNKRHGMPEQCITICFLPKWGRNY